MVKYYHILIVYYRILLIYIFIYIGSNRLRKVPTQVINEVLDFLRLPPLKSIDKYIEKDLELSTTQSCDTQYLIESHSNYTTNTNNIISTNTSNINSTNNATIKNGIISFKNIYHHYNSVYLSGLTNTNVNDNNMIINDNCVIAVSKKDISDNNNNNSNDNSNKNNTNNYNNINNNISNNNYNNESILNPEIVIEVVAKHFPSNYYIFYFA